MDSDPFFPIISTIEALTSKEVLVKHLERDGCDVRRRERGMEGRRDNEGYKRNKPLGKRLAMLLLK